MLHPPASGWGNRQTARKTTHKNKLDLQAVAFEQKDVISLVLVLMIDIVTYHLTAIGKHFRDKIYIYAEGH